MNWNYILGAWPSDGCDFGDDCEADNAWEAAIKVADHFGVDPGTVVCVENSATGERAEFVIDEVRKYVARRRA